MRILVLFAHPVETSFGAALHAKLVEALRARGHKVDDCDLNARRLRSGDVAPGPDRLSQSRGQSRAASRLTSTGCSRPRRSCSRFRSGTWGFRQSSRDSSTRSSCPASASPSARRRLHAVPAQHQASWRRVHLRRRAPADVLHGRSSPPFSDPLHAPDLRPGRALRLSRALRHESHQAGAARGVPQKGRGEVLDLVRKLAGQSSPEASSPSMAPRWFMSSPPAKSMNARTRADRRRSAWVRSQIRRRVPAADIRHGPGPELRSPRKEGKTPRQGPQPSTQACSGLYSPWRRFVPGGRWPRAIGGRPLFRAIVAKSDERERLDPLWT